VWGDFCWDEVTGSFTYSNDIGGGHYGEFTWNAELRQWDRLWSSHPEAPSISLIPGA
jgi:hypothetical protein